MWNEYDIYFLILFNIYPRYVLAVTNGGHLDWLAPTVRSSAFWPDLSKNVVFEWFIKFTVILFFSFMPRALPFPFNSIISDSLIR